MGKGKISTANRNFTEPLTLVDVGDLEDLSAYSTKYQLGPIIDVSSVRAVDMSTDGHHMLLAAKTDVALTNIPANTSCLINLYLDVAWDFSTARLNTDAGGMNDGTDQAAQAGFYAPFTSSTRIGAARYTNDGMYILFIQEGSSSFRTVRCKAPYLLPSTAGSTFTFGNVNDSGAKQMSTKGFWFSRDGYHMYQVEETEEIRIATFNGPYTFGDIELANRGTVTSISSIIREDTSQFKIGDVAGSHFDNKNIWILGRDTGVSDGEITDPVSGGANSDDRMVETVMSTANDLSTISAVSGSGTGSDIMFREVNAFGFPRAFFVHEELNHSGILTARNNGAQFSWIPFAIQFIGTATVSTTSATISFGSSAVSNVREGDLMLVFVSNDLTNTATTAPSGWTELYEFSGFDGTSYAAAYYKYATGSDTSFSKTYNNAFGHTAVLAVYRNAEVDENASKGGGFGYHFRQNSTDVLPIPETRAHPSTSFLVCIHEQDNTTQAGTTSFSTPQVNNENFVHRATASKTDGTAQSGTFVFDLVDIISGGTANVDPATFSASPSFGDTMLTTLVPIHNKNRGKQDAKHLELCGRKYTEAISSTAATTTHTPANFEDGDFFVRLYVQGGASTPGIRSAQTDVNGVAIEHLLGTKTGTLGTQNFRVSLGASNRDLDTTSDSGAITVFATAEIHMITDLYFKPYKKSRPAATSTVDMIDSAFSLVCDDISDFPSSGRILVSGPDSNNAHVNTEIMNYQSVFGTAILTIASGGRGVDGTTALFHETGATVTLLDDNDGYVGLNTQRSCMSSSNGGEGNFSLSTTSLTDGPTSSTSSSDSEVSVDLNKCQAPFVVVFAGLQEDDASTCSRAEFALDIDGTSVKEDIAFQEGIDSSENSAASGTESFNLVVGAKVFNTNQTGTLTIKMLDRGDDRMIVALPVEMK